MLKIIQNLFKSCVIFVRTGLALTIVVFIKITDLTANILANLLYSFVDFTLPIISKFIF